MGILAKDKNHTVYKNHRFLKEGLVLLYQNKDHPLLQINHFRNSLIYLLFLAHSSTNTLSLDFPYNLFSDSASTIGLFKSLINKTAFLKFTLNDSVYEMVLASLSPKRVTHFVPLIRFLSKKKLLKFCTNIYQKLCIFSIFFV